MKILKKIIAIAMVMVILCTSPLSLAHAADAAAMKIYIGDTVWKDSKGQPVKPVFVKNAVMITSGQMAALLQVMGYDMTESTVQEGSNEGAKLVRIYKAGSERNLANIVLAFWQDSPDVWAKGELYEGACPTPVKVINGVTMMPLVFCMDYFAMPVAYLADKNILQIGLTDAEMAALKGEILKLGSSVQEFNDKLNKYYEENTKQQAAKDAAAVQKQMIKRVRAYDIYDWNNPKKSSWTIAAEVKNYFIIQKMVKKGDLTDEDVYVAIEAGLSYYDTDSVLSAAKLWLGL